MGQAYDGAAVFSGRRKGVQIRMHASSAHALYFYCACHRLQHASIQAAESNSEIKQVFGMMSNVWKLFYYSPKKAETLKEVQSALSLPELKTVKRCLRAIKKELPALIVTCSNSMKQQVMLKLWSECSPFFLCNNLRNHLSC